MQSDVAVWYYSVMVARPCFACVQAHTLQYYSGNTKGGSAEWLYLLAEGGLRPGRVSAGT